MRLLLCMSIILFSTFARLVKCGNISNCCEVGHFYVICNGCNLEEVPHGLDPNITHLDLQNNFINELRESQFQEYPNLEELILRFNPLDILHPDAFKGLKELKTLDLLRMNTPSKWHNVNFSYMRNVEQFYMTFEVPKERGLSKNFVGRILPEFRKIKNLMIHPKSGPRGLKLPDGVSQLDKLDSLILCCVNLASVKGEISITMRQDRLKTLILRSIMFDGVYNSSKNFEFSFKNLDTLIFSGVTGFPTFYLEIYETFQHLKTFIHHNSYFDFEHLLEFIENHASLELKVSKMFQSWENLVMNVPELPSIPKKILSIPFANLKFLALEFESWTGHMQGCFNSFDFAELVNNPQSTTLKTLVIRCHRYKRPDFQDWEVKDLTAESFMEQFPKLATSRCNISISNNVTYVTKPGFRLSTIAQHTCISQLAIHLDYLDNTVFFDTSDVLASTLTFLNMSDTPVHILSQNYGFYELEVLDLQNCSLKDITHEFLQMPRLHSLNLNDNSLEKSFFEGNPFKELWNLTSLYLDNVSKNSSANVDLFASLQNLQTLSLTHNKFTYFQFWLDQLRKLRVLDLSHNDIRTIDSNVVNDLQMLSRYHRLEVIDLTENVLSCSCQNKDLLQWIRNTTATLKNFDSYLCYEDSYGTNIHIRDLTPKDITRLCEYPMYKLMIITTSVAFLLAAFGTYCIHTFRWKLRWQFYKLRRKFRIRFLNAPSSGLHVNNLRYHAFVAYNHSVDYEWVKNGLLPKVEGEWGLNLCVGLRDFLVGAAIAENIVNAVENSNKTLIILTPDFLTSQWCDFELHMALTRGHQHVIICYIQKIDHMKLTNVMKRLMKTLTYIEYADDKDGKELFWAKLQECLTGSYRNDVPVVSALPDTALYY